MGSGFVIWMIDPSLASIGTLTISENLEAELIFSDLSRYSWNNFFFSSSEIVDGFYLTLSACYSVIP